MHLDGHVISQAWDQTSILCIVSEISWCLTRNDTKSSLFGFRSSSLCFSASRVCSLHHKQYLSGVIQVISKVLKLLKDAGRHIDIESQEIPRRLTHDNTLDTH